MTAAPDLAPIRRALLSTSDKRGIDALGARLAARGVALISTGGTAAALRAAGLDVRDVADVTGAPEMLGGRVKTLHPAIHGGLLARRDDPEHRAALQAAGIEDIDLLVVNLYPFGETVAAGADFDACVEQIDIGGPALLRAAAKNHAFVSVLSDPADYDAFAGALENHNGAAPLALRRRLAAKAYAHTARYDAAVAGWFAAQTEPETAFPETLTVAARRAQSLRYGENAHQRAALYLTAPARPGAASARVLQGKELSYNNIGDADAAFELAADLAALGRPAAVIVKHANPCGAALGDRLEAAYRAAKRCDPVSAFGGVIAFSQTIDAAAARAVTEIFAEVVIAPDAAAEALEIFSAKRNLRVLLTGGLPQEAGPPLVRSVAGGLLAQERDDGRLAPEALTLATRRAPTEAERRDLMFAWIVAKHVKSNAIVYAKNEATVGVGAGQMSRVDAARIAALKAAEAAAAEGLSESLAVGSVVASDAFFPFADGLETAAAAGAVAAIQPGGSQRDAEVVAAADAAGMAMLLTGMRHFRH